MTINITLEGEVVHTVEVNSVEEYQEFVANEFPRLLEGGYKVYCTGSIG